MRHAGRDPFSKLIYVDSVEALSYSEEALEHTKKVARGRLSEFLDRQKGQACTDGEVQTSAERFSLAQSYH